MPDKDPHGTDDRSQDVEELSVQDASDKLLNLADDSEEPEATHADDDEQGGDDENEDDDGQDDGDEDEDDGDEQDAGDEQDEGDEDDDEGTDTFTVKVNGEDTEVSRDELVAGYSRHADYTRKTQELAEDKKKVSAGAQESRDARDRYIEGLQTLNKSLEQSEPDWEKVKAEQPDQYPKLFADWQVAEGKRKVLRDGQAQLEAEKAEDDADIAAEFVIEQRTLLHSLIPDLADLEKGKALEKELSAYALATYGVKQEELDSVTNHIQIDLLHKGMLYDRLTNKAKKVRGKKRSKTTGPVSKPTGNPAKGRKSRRREGKVQAEARGRLAQSGDVRDAITALTGMEDFAGEQ